MEALGGLIGTIYLKGNIAENCYSSGKINWQSKSDRI
jgi:hypothetical protein